ncbi:MAG: general secretion pathway protein GspK [Bdellovibrionales bacterium]|nr:general secretion pathway protein GspK [Bdellovibrionales bacterium]
MRSRSHITPLTIRYSDEDGIALILALFIVALCTVIVTQLTYTGMLDTSLHLLSKRSLESEYLMKSAINFGRAILKADVSEEDAEQDAWGPFLNGIEIPKEILNVRDPSVRVELEIRPVSASLPLRAVVSGDRANVKWRDVFQRFFEKMGFDSDELPDESGLFPGQVFDSSQVVANMIDYMDTDEVSYEADDFVGGIESNLPDSATFPNRSSLRWIGELYAIPGMNADRVRRISPFVTAFGNGRTVNINLAPRIVLESLHPEIGASQAEAIIQLRSEEAFTNVNKKGRLAPDIIPEEVYNEITPLIGIGSRWFQILAKVDYGSSTSFMRAYVSQTKPGELPLLKITEMF